MHNLRSSPPQPEGLPISLDNKLDECRAAKIFVWVSIVPGLDIPTKGGSERCKLVGVLYESEKRTWVVVVAGMRMSSNECD